MSWEFCPECFTEVSSHTRCCPCCGGTLQARRRGDYDERLVRALRHPVAEVRMGAIVVLQKRGTISACGALAHLGLGSPADLPQSTAVVKCLASMLPAPAARENLEYFATQHGARSIRRHARDLLAAYDASSGQEKERS